MKKIITPLFFAVLLLSLCLLAACGEPEVIEPEETYEVDHGAANGGTAAATVAETGPETESETEPETETEADTTPYFDPESLDQDTYQGMTPDVPYSLTFSSNGDGTCVVSRITANILYEGSYTVEIPGTSPAGDTVVGLSCAPTYNVPRYMTAEGYAQMVEWVETYYKKCVQKDIYEGDFYYRSYMSYFYLKDPALASSQNLANDLIREFPLCEFMRVYIFDYTATSVEYVYISQAMTSAAPWYTPEWCYADLLKLKEMADSKGITDPYLEQCLAEHSDVMTDCVTVKLPKTITKIETWEARLLSAMGITSLTFEGTTDEFRAISNVEESKVVEPLVVHCIDGDVSYPVEAKRYPPLTE